MTTTLEQLPPLDQLNIIQETTGMEEIAKRRMIDNALKKLSETSKKTSEYSEIERKIEREEDKLHQQFELKEEGLWSKFGNAVKSVCSVIATPFKWAINTAIEHPILTLFLLTIGGGAIYLRSLEQPILAGLGAGAKFVQKKLQELGITEAVKKGAKVVSDRFKGTQVGPK